MVIATADIWHHQAVDLALHCPEMTYNVYGGTLNPAHLYNSLVHGTGNGD